MNDKVRKYRSRDRQDAKCQMNIDAIHVSQVRVIRACARSLCFTMSGRKVGIAPT